MRFLLAGLSLATSCTLALAQAPGAVAAPPQVKDGANQRTERLVVEDGGTRVDELRVGGQTKSITVQSKAGVPAYEIQPARGPRSRGGGRDDSPAGGGQRVWNVLKF